MSGYAPGEKVSRYSGMKLPVWRLLAEELAKVTSKKVGTLQSKREHAPQHLIQFAQYERIFVMY